MTKEYVRNCINNHRGENPFKLNPFGEMDMMTNEEVVDFICDILNIVEETEDDRIEDIISII